MKTPIRLALLACGALLTAMACADRADSERDASSTETTTTTTTSSAVGTSATDTGTASNTTTPSSRATTNAKKNTKTKQKDAQSGTTSGSTSGTGTDFSGAEAGDHPDVGETDTTGDMSTSESESQIHGTNSDVMTVPEYEMQDESTVSGATTGTASETTDTSQPATSDPAFSEAAAQASIADQANTFYLDRAEEMAKAYEPKSKSPYRVGTTSLTGEPRSHAQAGPVTVFTDPTVAPLMDMSLKEKERIAHVNLDQFPLDKRGEFKRTMERRLSRLETRIDYLKGDVAEQASTPGSDPRSMYKSLEAKGQAAEVKLHEADSVSAERWDEYKQEFREQIADLERSYDQVRTAVR